MGISFVKISEISAKDFIGRPMTIVATEKETVVRRNGRFLFLMVKMDGIVCLVNPNGSLECEKARYSKASDLILGEMGSYDFYYIDLKTGYGGQ